MESEVARLINESLEMDKTKTKKVNLIKNGQSKCQNVFFKPKITNKCVIISAFCRGQTEAVGMKTLMILRE